MFKQKKRNVKSRDDGFPRERANEAHVGTTSIFDWPT